uniref:Reverse transcriptase domain-containing protein n=1 Tax=Chenopodium quinoa TaxID=63459 RepID=A0A803L7F3_CHEQI
MGVITEGPVLMEEQKSHLCRNFSREDVKKALWSIDDNRAPGPNGYFSKFFKSAWNIVGDEVCNVVLEFFATSKLLKQINTTLITLVLKVELASQVQGAFIAGRSILDNILVCQDLLKDYNNKRKAPLYCEGGRGIREGDPMSPLLFVLVLEYLTRLMRKISKLRRFRFYSRCKSLGLNHLVFADDLMLFCNGDKNYVELLLRGLKTFEKCVGLRSNVDKSALYFGNVADSIKEQILGYSGFIVSQTPFRYLGILLNARYLKNADFDGLIEKMLAKITCWSSRNLSYIARVVLVNYVLLSMHTY